MYGHYGFYDQLYQSVNDNPDDSHLYIYVVLSKFGCKIPNLIPNRLSVAINIIDKSKTLHNIFAPDVLLWDPITQFQIDLQCPQCITIDVTNQLHATRWKHGKSLYDQPRKLYYIQKHVLLVI